MRSVKAFSLILLLFFSLSSVACGEIEPDSPYADSPYKAMEAYVAGISAYDSIGAKPIPFSVEIDFRYSSTESAFVDEAAPSGKVFRVKGEDRFMTYVDTTPDRYTDRLYDTYECRRVGTLTDKYTFERETGRFVRYSPFGAIGAGDGFASDAEAEAHARALVLPYLDGDLDGYTATVHKRKNTDYTHYEVLFVQRIDGITVSEICVGFSNSDLPSRLELYGYRANTAEREIPAGTDATAREKIAERVAPFIGNGYYERYEVAPGVLYDDGRPFLLYEVELISETSLGRVDFLVYLE